MVGPVRKWALRLGGAAAAAVVAVVVLRRGGGGAVHPQFDHDGIIADADVADLY